MDSNSCKTSLLKNSIQETEFTEDIVTECLTANCSECEGEYVNIILHHKFVCRCECHAKKEAEILTS
jgi:hypothetical protein